MGGLVTAHALRRLLPATDEIVVFDASPVHTFWPSLLWVMTGTRRAEQAMRPFSTLRERGITVVTAPITRIDPGSHTITAGERQWTGDVLVLALGAQLDPALVPGLAAEAGNFYTVPGAEAVRNSLRTLTGGAGGGAD